MIYEDNGKVTAKIMSRDRKSSKIRAKRVTEGLYIQK